MLWGAFIMILVDHILGYEGGAFIEIETDGLIKSGFVLGLAMLVPVFLDFWNRSPKKCATATFAPTVPRWPFPRTAVRLPDPPVRW